MMTAVNIDQSVGGVRHRLETYGCRVLVRRLAGEAHMSNAEGLWKLIPAQRRSLQVLPRACGVKINVFFYGITGAILSFYFVHPDIPLLRLSLAFPLAMSVVLGFLFLVGAVLATVPRRETFEIRDALGLKAAPEIGVLILFLGAFAALLLVVAGGIAWLLASK